MTANVPSFTSQLHNTADMNEQACNELLRLETCRMLRSTITCICTLKSNLEHDAL